MLQTIYVLNKEILQCLGHSKIQGFLLTVVSNQERVIMARVQYIVYDCPMIIIQLGKQEGVIELIFKSIPPCTIQFTVLLGQGKSRFHLKKENWS